MRVPLFQLDAFTRQRYRGNPAAVMRLEQFLADDTLQAIAAENNLAETAFIVPHAEDYQLRWFTPAVEVPLCGHATLASAAVVLDHLEPGRMKVRFHTKSGVLSVRRSGDAFVMDFPARPSSPIDCPPELSRALGVRPTEVLADATNYLVVLDSERAVRGLKPDIPAIAKLDRVGVIVTAPGSGAFDIVSRYFTPARGIPEDPVTGGAHCALTPYWAKQLGKSEIRAFQASWRGGELLCRLRGERVELEGFCVLFMAGVAEV